MADRTAQGFGNFIKVASAALVRPSRAVTIGLGIVTAVALPQIALPAIAMSAAASLAMAWSDINDPQFMQQVLKPQSAATSNLFLLDKAIREISQSDTAELPGEVKQDIAKAIKILKQIQAILREYSAKQAGGVDFAVEQTSELSKRLKELINNEAMAREFLNNTDQSLLQSEISELEDRINSTTDNIAKSQLKKAKKNKQTQLDNIAQMEQKLYRIDAYIANILTALETTYTQLARLQLSEDSTASSIDTSDVLTSTMQDIINELDNMNELKIDLPSEVEEAKKSSKQSSALHN